MIYVHICTHILILKIFILHWLNLCQPKVPKALISNNKVPVKTVKHDKNKTKNKSESKVNRKSNMSLITNKNPEVLLMNIKYRPSPREPSGKAILHQKSFLNWGFKMRTGGTGADAKEDVLQA